MRRESTEVRQEQIKKAVLDLIITDGLHQVSTRNLAKQIGLTEGAIFRHFKTKRDIIKAIMDDVSVDLVGALRKIVLKPISAEKKMLDYLCANVMYLKENRGITILLFSEAAHLGDKELKNKLNEILSEQKQFIVKLVNDGINEGVWSNKVNPEDFAMIYLGIPITFNIELVLNPDTLIVDNFCKKMYSIIERTLKK